MSFKKVEQEDNDKVKNKDQSMFTYAVSMIVSVFAENEEKARQSLDENGGFVSHREVDLKDSVAIYKPE
jgi:hypothetical protein